MQPPHHQIAAAAAAAAQAVVAAVHPCAAPRRRAEAEAAPAGVEEADLGAVVAQPPRLLQLVALLTLTSAARRLRRAAA